MGDFDNCILPGKGYGDRLPTKAQNLARRALVLAQGQKDVRIKLELITVGNRWLLMVNDGARVEDLGE